MTICKRINSCLRWFRTARAAPLHVLKLLSHVIRLARNNEFKEKKIQYKSKKCVHHRWRTPASNLTQQIFFTLRTTIRFGALANQKGKSNHSKWEQNPGEKWLTSSFRRQSINRIIALPLWSHLSTQSKRCGRRQCAPVCVDVDDANLDRGMVFGGD